MVLDHQARVKDPVPTSPSVFPSGSIERPAKTNVETFEESSVKDGQSQEKESSGNNEEARDNLRAKGRSSISFRKYM
jgi:hypothetical protein